MRTAIDEMWRALVFNDTRTHMPKRLFVDTLFFWPTLNHNHYLITHSDGTIKKLRILETWRRYRETSRK